MAAMKHNATPALGVPPCEAGQRANAGSETSAAQAKHALRWRQLPAVPWGPRDMAAVANHQGMMWVLGGWRMTSDAQHALYNDVWRSADGERWEMVTDKAPWRARCYQSAVSFRDRLWMLGGYVVEPPTNVLGDVWASKDGADWELVCARPPWEDREHAGCLVWEDHLYLAGGVNYGPPFHCFAEVWRSPDGSTWELVTGNAPWGPRRGFGFLAHGGLMWLLGGADSQGKLYNDVWVSSNGKDWRCLCEHAPWQPRVTMRSLTARGRLWLLGGNLDRQGVRGCQEVWSSADGLDWSLEQGDWPAKVGCVAFAQGGPGEEDIFVFGGFDGPQEISFHDDAWRGSPYGMRPAGQEKPPDRQTMASVHPVSQLKTGLWQQADSGRVFDSQTSENNTLGNIHFNVMAHEIFDRHVTPGQKVLDVGCGTGLTSLHLAGRGCRVVACDASASMLEVLRAKKNDLDIEIRQGDAFCLPAEAGEFDVVVSRMFLTHFPDWYLILREFARVLKQGGLAVYTFANAEHYQLAEAAGPVDPEGFVFSPQAQGGQFSAHVDQGFLRMLAQSAGMELVSVTPLGLFYDNALFCSCLGAEEFKAYKERFNQFLEHQIMRDFLVWFERSVAQKLPAHAAYHNVTVLRKT